MCQDREGGFEVKVVVIDSDSDGLEVLLGIGETGLVTVGHTDQSVDATIGLGQIGFEAGNGAIDLGVELALIDLLLEKFNLLIRRSLVTGLLELGRLDPPLGEIIDAIIALGVDSLGPGDAFVTVHGEESIVPGGVDLSRGLIGDGFELQVQGILFELGLGGGLVGLHQGVDLDLLILGQGRTLDVGDRDGERVDGEQQGDHDGQNENHRVVAFHEIFLQRKGEIVEDHLAIDIFVVFKNGG